MLDLQKELNLSANKVRILDTAIASLESNKKKGHITLQEVETFTPETRAFKPLGKYIYIYI